VLLRPTVKAKRVFTPQSYIGRALRHVIQEVLFGFKPDTPESRAKGQKNVLFLDSHRFDSPVVARYHLAIVNLVDPQRIESQQPQRRFSSLAPPTRIASDLVG
jgi:hypothetical protein